MKRLRLYIETSVWNYYFADDTPEKKAVTLNFFKKVQKGDYEIFISDIVIEEISRAEEGKRKPGQCKYNCIKSCNPKTTSFCIADALLAAYKGDLDDGFVFTGINAGKVRHISTVSAIFGELINEYKQAKMHHQDQLQTID